MFNGVCAYTIHLPYYIPYSTLTHTMYHIPIYSLNTSYTCTGKDGKVSLEAFKAWDEITAMVEDGLLTQNRLDELTNNAKNKLTFDQFQSLYETVDDAADYTSYQGGDEGEKEVEEEEEELSDEDYQAALQEAFNELKGTSYHTKHTCMLQH